MNGRIWSILADGLHSERYQPNFMLSLSKTTWYPTRKFSAFENYIAFMHTKYKKNKLHRLGHLRPIIPIGSVDGSTAKQNPASAPCNINQHTR